MAGLVTEIFPNPSRLMGGGNYRGSKRLETEKGCRLDCTGGALSFQRTPPPARPPLPITGCNDSKGKPLKGQGGPAMEYKPRTKKMGQPSPLRRTLHPRPGEGGVGVPWASGRAPTSARARGNVRSTVTPLPGHSAQKKKTVLKMNQLEVESGRDPARGS